MHSSAVCAGRQGRANLQTSYYYRTLLYFVLLLLRSSDQLATSVSEPPSRNLTRYTVQVYYGVVLIRWTTSEPPSRSAGRAGQVALPALRVITRCIILLKGFSGLGDLK